MKFSCLQQDILPVLQAVARSVGVRSTLPVLDNILLSVEDKKLKLAATNLEIGVIKLVPVAMVNPGEITVPAKTIVELVSGLGAIKIEFETEGEILAISSGNLKAKVNGISAAEFPAIPLSSEKGLSFPKEAFLSTAQILFASAVDEGRPVLTGVLTEATDGKLEFVATDGFRLAHRTIILPKGHVSFTSLIPRRTYEEILRVMGEEDVEQVNIALSPNQNQVIFTIGATMVSSRLIEGQFPSWEKIIPTQTASRVLIDKELFLQALKLAAVFAKSEANIVVLTSQKGSLSLQSQAKELGSQENEVEAAVEGDPIKVAFNSKFLIEAVSNCPATQLMMEFSGPLSPALIKPVGVEGLEYIVMPVRLS